MSRLTKFFEMFSSRRLKSLVLLALMSATVEADIVEPHPEFDPRNTPNVTGVLGDIVELPCLLFNIASRTDGVISWERDRDQELLTSGTHVKTLDSRFKIRHDIDSGIWFMSIDSLAKSDEGHYTCGYTLQKQGKLMKSFYLRVIEDSDDRRWRTDSRCGEFDMLQGNLSDIQAECDPNGTYPCCSGAGWCGFTKLHCDCGFCVDYRLLQSTVSTTPEGVLPKESSSSMPSFDPRSPINFVGVEGHDVQLVCFVRHLTEHSSVLWIRSRDQQIFTNTSKVTKAGTRIHVHFDQNKPELRFLTIKSTNKSDQGQYTCVVTSYDHPNISRSMNLTTRDDSPNTRRWRPDNKCPILVNGTRVQSDTAAECDLEGAYPCCDSTGNCGFTEDQCNCETCFDYRNYLINTSPIATCEPLFVSVGNQCLLFGSELTVWADAKVWCEDMGGRLATFYDTNHMRHAVEVIRRKDVSLKSAYWVGLFTKGHPQPGGMSWRWVTGQRQTDYHVDSVKLRVMNLFGKAEKNQCGFLDGIIESQTDSCDAKKLPLCEGTALLE